MVSKEMQKWIDINRQAKEATKNVELSAELILTARQNFDQMLGTIPVPEELTCQKDEVNGIKCEYYFYTKERPEEFNNKIVLFIHGGGFATGSIASRRYAATHILMNAQMDGCSIEYTQYPEGKHPEGLVDAIRAYHGLLAKGYLPENIYLLGESGGAMLCMALTLYLKDHHEGLPGKVCVFSPPTRLDIENESRLTRDERDPVVQGILNDQLSYYFSENDKKTMYCSSIYGNYEGFPELLVNVGTEEVLWDDSVQLVEKAKAAGVKASLKVWDELFHVFVMFPAPESEEAMKYNGDFLAGRIE